MKRIKDKKKTLALLRNEISIKKHERTAFFSNDRLCGVDKNK